MAHARRFRFATELHEPFPERTWMETAKEIEQLGYSTVFFPDHFDEGPGPISAMAVCAAATTTLNVGALVLDCDFRHPAVLARELATIDALSGGRLEVGLGAGWKAVDYERSGIPMDRPGSRVGRLIEHAAVLKGLWSEGPFSFSGEHYEIHDLDGTPAPHRPGGPPILVGGGRRGCCAGPGPRPTSSASTPRSTRARSTRPPPRTPWPSASTRRWAGSGRAPATGSTTSS